MKKIKEWFEDNIEIMILIVATSCILLILITKL